MFGYRHGAKSKSSNSKNAIILTTLRQRMKESTYTIPAGGHMLERFHVMPWRKI